MVNIKRLAANAYRKIFRDYPKELEKAVGSCKTLLDVGCGENSPVRHFSIGKNQCVSSIGSNRCASTEGRWTKGQYSKTASAKANVYRSETGKLYCVGVDAFEPSIRKSKAEGIHDRYHKMNILKIGEKFRPNSFDCVLASDLIEHLTKTEGLKLLGMMEKIARAKVIVFTPNGFLPQQGYGNNPFQLHKSGWTVDEMKKLGYHVIGINGWKPLRGEQASIKLRPKLFWQIISDLTQLLTRNRPEKAFQILCVKPVNVKDANITA